MNPHHQRPGTVLFPANHTKSAGSHRFISKWIFCWLCLPLFAVQGEAASFPRVPSSPVPRGDLATASHEDLSAERRANGVSRYMKCSAIVGVRTGCINPVLPGATIHLNVLPGDCLLSWALYGGSSFGSYGIYSFSHGDCLP